MENISLSAKDDMKENITDVLLSSCLMNIDLYMISKDITALKNAYRDAIICSDRAPEVYAFHLIRFVLAASLGIFLPEIFDILEIKCMQLDTLGYLMSEIAPVFLQLEYCKQFCKNSYNLYLSNRRDTWNLISQSLDSSSFISVLDFYEFSLRLENSLQYLSTDVLALKTAILSNPVKDLNLSDKSIQSSVTRLQKQQNQKYVDNRDFKIFYSIDPCGRLAKLVALLTGFKLNETKYYPSIINNSAYPDCCDALDTLARLIASITNDAKIVEHALPIFKEHVLGELERIKKSEFDFNLVKSVNVIVVRLKELHLVLSRLPLEANSIRFIVEIKEELGKILMLPREGLLPGQITTIDTIYNYLQKSF